MKAGPAFDNKIARCTPATKQRKRELQARFDTLADGEMNLRARHFPLLLLGGAIGAAAGWFLSPFLHRFITDIQPVLALIFGSIAGMAFVLLILLIRAAHDPNAEVPHNFSLINGSGSTLLGKKDEADDGSYIATEWFVLFFVPIFPVCRYRVTKLPESFWRGRRYTIHAKYPPTIADSIRVYAVVIGVFSVIAAVAFFVVK